VDLNQKEVDYGGLPNNFPNTPTDDYGGLPNNLDDYSGFNQVSETDYGGLPVQGNLFQYATVASLSNQGGDEPDYGGLPIKGKKQTQNDDYGGLPINGRQQRH